MSNTQPQPIVIYVTPAHNELLLTELEDNYVNKLKGYCAKSIEVERNKLFHIMLSQLTSDDARREALKQQRFYALSRQEETELFAILRSSDDIAMQEHASTVILQSVSGIIVTLAEKYRYKCPLQEPAELYTYGVLGAQDALLHYDSKKANGARFSTFAYRYIKHAIAYGCKLLSTPFNMTTAKCKRLNRLWNIKKALERQLGRTPTVAEIQQCLPKYSKVYINTFKDGIPNSISIDQPVDIVNKLTTVGDTIADPCEGVLERNSKEELFEILRDNLYRLDQRTREIVNLRFGLDGDSPLKLEEVGKLFNLSPQQVSHITNVALIQLRAMMTMPNTVA